MSDPGSPTIRRRELGALLRSLRMERGWKIKHVAEQLSFSTPKVSRFETGQRGVSPHDIQALCDLYQVDPAMRERLVNLAAEGKQPTWWQSRSLPYSDYVGLEAAATTISDFGLALVPGLLQTADYARETLSAIRPDFSADVIEQRVAGRIERQRRLTSDNPPQFDAVIDEAVLHRRPTRLSVMKAQLEYLAEAGELPNVSVRILPFAAGLLQSSNNKFIILTFAQPDPSTTVFVENLTRDWDSDLPEEVQIYEKAFSLMLEMSYSPAQSRDMIMAVAAGLRD